MRRLFYLLILLCLTFSCTKANRETIFVNQETRISNFINSKTAADTNVTFVNNEGVYRVIMKKGEGDALSPNGNLSFYYAGYTFNGSVSISNLFATNHAETAKKAGWSVEDVERYQIMTVKLDEAGFVKGLSKGLEGVQAGERAYVLFSGKYGFGGLAHGIVPANSALIYEIWVEAVTNN